MKLVKGKTKKQYEKESHLKRTYGLSIDQYNDLITQQGGKCKICSKEFGAEFPHHGYVDHDHKTGNIRRLLCGPCNSRLGWYETHLEKIEEYLCG